MSTFFKFGSVKLNKTDFDEVNWQEVISKCKKKDCLCYCTCFNSRAEEEKSNANLKNLAIFSLFKYCYHANSRDKKRRAFLIRLSI
jgi:hypothetical protein